MNRPIKFRVWNHKEELFFYQDDTHRIDLALCYWETTKHVKWPQQYTGLKDKNGKDIYEGDIVKCNWLAELGVTELDCEASGEIKWNEENPCFYLELFKEYKRFVSEDGEYSETDLPIFNEGYNECYSYEVIGNIYQNPELIDQTTLTNTK
jgi:uncharacterized phage protein (TIGR01671 family)